MDFFTEILISCAIGILFYFVFLKAGLGAEKAKLGGVIFGSWLFVQLPKYTRSESELKWVSVTLRSYFAGFIIVSYILANVLGFKPISMPRMVITKRF